MNDAGDRAEIDFWYGKRQRFRGSAQRFINILGNIESRNTLYHASYLLDDRDRTPVTIGPNAFRLVGRGDFNIEIPVSSLEAGRHEVEMIAVDTTGAESREKMRFEYEPADPWPPELRVDWEQCEEISDGVQVVDGRWLREPRGIRPAELGYDRLCAIGEMNNRDFEITVEFTVLSYGTDPLIRGWPSNGPAFGLCMRWQGHHNLGDILPGRGILPFGSLTWFKTHLLDGEMYLSILSGAAARPLARIATTAANLELGRQYILRSRVETLSDGHSRYCAKFWPFREVEPSGWQVEGQGLPGELSSGSILFVSHHTDVVFGDFSFRSA